MAVLDTCRGLEVRERMTHLGNQARGQCMGTVLREAATEASRGQVTKALVSHAGDCKC